MRLRNVVLFAFACIPATVEAASIEQALKKLSPVERAHQACIVKGLDMIRREKRLPGVDRLVAETKVPATFDNNIVSAAGGAIRSKNRWFAVKFQCTVTADQMKATAFSYELGAEIPSDKWESYGLWQ
jgi:predicted outer membrane repeat protein